MVEYKDFPVGSYKVIVVDPPWDIEKIRLRVRPNQVGMDYKTLGLEDIGSLPVGSLIDVGGSMCFLWVTQKYLFDARRILEGWGFKYLLTMVWEKTYGVSSGMALCGFRWNAEFILVGYTGKLDRFPSCKLVPVVFQAENIKHSMKPDLFYKMVERFGDKRVDLFARGSRYGWDVWGDEIIKEGI